MDGDETEPSGDPKNPADAVELALDDLLGPRPTDLVEEQPEPKDPSDENEAQAHLYRSPSRFYGLGSRPRLQGSGTGQ